MSIVQLEPIPEASFLQKDGIEVCRAILENERIRTHEELLAVLRSGAGETAILIPRLSVDPAYFAIVEEQANECRIPNHWEQYSLWNATGGTTPGNAVPHIHSAYNCHASFEPSSVPTGFFLSEAVIDAVRKVCRNMKHCLEIRSHLEATVDAYDRTGDKKIFFYSLHELPIPTRGGGIASLSCIHDIQQRVRADGGMYEVDLNETGILGIPSTAVHGRSLLQNLTRDHLTAWRYVYPHDLAPTPS